MRFERGEEVVPPAESRYFPIEETKAFIRRKGDTQLCQF